MVHVPYESLDYKNNPDNEGWPIVCVNIDDLSWQTFPVSDDLIDQPENAAHAIMECWLKLPEFQEDDPFDPDWRDEWSLQLHGNEWKRMAVWTPYRGESVTFVW